MPPGTTLSDCMVLIGISVGGAMVDYMIGLAGLRREFQGEMFLKWCMRSRPGRKLKGAEAVGAVREFYRSPVAFLIVGLPWFAFCCGNIVMSLLRDAGWIVFSWPFAINCVLMAVWLKLAAGLMFRRMSRMVAVEGREADAALVGE